MSQKSPPPLDKNIIYKVSDNNQQQSSQLIQPNNNIINHEAKSEQIELETKTHLKNEIESEQQTSTWRYKLENILDFNLKFESPLLERFYKKSYLPVTRLIFSQYLLYLIIVFVSWIVYFLVCDTSNSKIYGEIINYENNGSETCSMNIISRQSYKSTILVSYSIGACVALAATFLYLILAELKESHYRYLEKLLKENESSTKVDCKMAERDLKKAMQEVLKKEKENSGLSELLASKYARVSRSRDLYAKLANPIALCVVALMFGLCFVGFSAHLDQVSHFIMFSECLLLLYVIYPFQMAVPVFFGLIFSIFFEVISCKQLADLAQNEIFTFVLIKILLHLSIHLIGSYLKLSVQAVKRDTFLKVAHMYRAHMASQQDKEITERMIKSIMPPLFTHVFGKPEEFKKSVNCMHMMRPLFIYPVSELSILFADIVGFTRMSSTKTAEELVFLLNDLYGRFDRICEKTNCEKISTLGDCYYCVSGCLNTRQDHAKCCVEMGLLMIREIEMFNKMHAVDVNMRVGVHTGNALCGFIGGKRFRFDVWSSDVTLANKMESTGRPGSVHISQTTYDHLKDVGYYNLETAEPYSGKPTYFVMRQTKKETVADALKQNASNNSTNRFATEDLEPSSENILKEALTTPIADQVVSNGVGGDYNENLLVSALKNAQFFQPDVNMFTMQFKSSNEEKKYHSYLMGLSKVVLKDQNQLENKAGFMEKNSSVFWKRPQNSFFIAILVAFSVNICVCTAYVLSLVASKHSICLYRKSSVYASNLILILSVFFSILLIQALFLTVYFVQCCQFKKTNKRKRTFLFDQPNRDVAQLKNSSSTTTTMSVMNYNAVSGGGIGTNARLKLDARQQNSYVFKRYFLIHFISILFICLTPIFIITTIYPVLSSMLNISLIPFIKVSDEEATNLSDLCPEDASINNSRRINSFSLYTCLAFTIALINFCSFIQLSSLLKTIVALMFTLIYGLSGFIGLFSQFDLSDLKNQTLLNQLRVAFENQTKIASEQNQPIGNNIIIISFNLYTTFFLKGFLKENILILVDFGLLCTLIWLINRQSELIQRLGFKCDQNANMKVTYATEQKELANWLIEVVLPSHVVSHVQAKKQYSRNYDCVGVLFVSLCNFGEFFEETYEGGRELLRVLNEITVDFDRLFDEPKYANVEKIKSIGSTFMIASGLCTNSGSTVSSSNGNTNISHLYDLIDFALELSEKLDAFNSEAMSVCHFKFKMRMGFHCGPVTAGVIGTERLLYDIWGDTVNVASRMDSTGQAGLLQTTEESVNKLNSSYKFELRGPVHIKGKDSMITYTMDPRLNKKLN